MVGGEHSLLKMQLCILLCSTVLLMAEFLNKEAWSHLAATHQRPCSQVRL